MKFSISSSPLETARSLIVRLQELMNEAPDKICHIALSGGSTPALMFDLWASEYKENTPWERIRLYWVDERCVPPTHPESNYGMTRDRLLEKVPLSPEYIFRIHGEAVPEEEAQRYSAQVAEHLPHSDGWVIFDAVLLGAGDDGHTSSIFPGQEELLTIDKTYAIGIHPSSGQKRIALTGAPMLHARRVFFLITGSNKASVVRTMKESGESGPAAYIAHRARNVELFLDAEAAAEISTTL